MSNMKQNGKRTRSRIVTSSTAITEKSKSARAVSVNKKKGQTAVTLSNGVSKASKGLQKTQSADNLNKKPSSTKVVSDDIQNTERKRKAPVKKVEAKRAKSEEPDTELQDEVEVESLPETVSDTEHEVESASQEEVDTESQQQAGDEADDATNSDSGEATVKPERKRKSPKIKEEVEVIKSKDEDEAGPSSANIVVRTDVASRAVIKRKKILLELPKLPSVSGVLFVIGDNDVGQLGLGEDVPVKTRPAEVDFPSRFVDIAAGGMHSVCLTDQGEVYTFGCNDEGALGRPTDDEDASEYIPKRTQVPGVVVRISAGDSHSAALTENGQVYIWGNFRGNEGPMGLTADGAKQTTPMQILNNVVIVAIASGSEHLVCLSNEGVVYTCGCGENGQLGRVSERSSKSGGRKGLADLLVPAAINMSHKKAQNIWTSSYATFVKARDSGEIYAFGLNNYNQLGFGIQDEKNDNVRFHPKKITSFRPELFWRRISGGQHHALALNGQGQVFSLGRKDYGRLGLGEDSGDINVPTIIPILENENCVDVSSGNVVSFSVTETGSVFSWGMGTNNQLGHGNDDDSHIPKLIQGKLLNSWHVFKVSGGGQHTLILANRKAVTQEKSSTETVEKKE